MNSFYFLKLASILLILLSTAHLLQGKRPNVVFILTDDQRADALSCMGHRHLKTPKIDRLADEGALFRNHFCTTSLCSPSRASILGGLYAHTHGVVNNFTDYPRDLPTFLGSCRRRDIPPHTLESGTWERMMRQQTPRL